MRDGAIVVVCLAFAAPIAICGCVGPDAAGADAAVRTNHACSVIFTCVSTEGTSEGFVPAPACLTPEEAARVVTMGERFCPEPSEACTEIRDCRFDCTDEGVACTCPRPGPCLQNGTPIDI